MCIASKLTLQIYTIHNEYVQAFLYGQGGVEVDESEAEREDIVAGAELKEFAYRTLSEQYAQLVFILPTGEPFVAGQDGRWKCGSAELCLCC